MKLLNCPLCDGEPSINYCDEMCCGSLPREISCECGLCLYGSWINDEEAITQWNTRPLPNVKFIQPTIYPIINSTVEYITGCTSARYCSYCNVIVTSSCMCLSRTCNRCKHAYKELPKDVSGIKSVQQYEWEKLPDTPSPYLLNKYL